MIKLYGVIPSRSNRVHWALEEIGCPYEFYQLDFSKGDQRGDFFKGLNPAGKMPVLQDDDFVLTESLAIVNYLGEKFPESRLTPPGGTRDRAKYDQWTCFVISELEQPLWTKGKHTFALPEAQRKPAVIETALWEFERAAKLLSQGLAGRRFLVGDGFTSADIFAAHTLRWAVKFQFSIAYPGLEDYLERMEKRPAFARIWETEKLPLPC